MQDNLHLHSLELSSSLAEQSNFNQTVSLLLSLRTLTWQMPVHIQTLGLLGKHLSTPNN